MLERDNRITQLQLAPPETTYVKEVVYVSDTVWTKANPRIVYRDTLSVNVDSIRNCVMRLWYPRKYLMVDSSIGLSEDRLDTVRLKYTELIFDDRPADSLWRELFFDPIKIRTKELIKTVTLPGFEQSWLSEAMETTGYAAVIAAFVFVLVKLI